MLSVFCTHNAEPLGIKSSDVEIEVSLSKEVNVTVKIIFNVSQ